MQVSLVSLSQVPGGLKSDPCLQALGEVGGPLQLNDSLPTRCSLPPSYVINALRGEQRDDPWELHRGQEDGLLISF